MFLQGRVVTLRALETEDLDFVRDLINDPEVESTIVGWSWPKPRKEQEQWFMDYVNSEKKVRYIIETVAEGRVGITGLRNIDWKNGSASGAGIRIRKDVQSKGLATDAYMTLFRYAFEELRLHRINTSAFEDNVPSLRFLEKCGCKREGLQREAVYKGGRYRNLVTLAVLDRDYFEVANTYWNKGQE